jgi:hypothetical protein
MGDRLFLLRVEALDSERAGGLLDSSRRHVGTNDLRLRGARLLVRTLPAVSPPAVVCAPPPLPRLVVLSAAATPSPCAVFRAAPAALLSAALTSAPAAAFADRPSTAFATLPTASFSAAAFGTLPAALLSAPFARRSTVLLAAAVGTLPATSIVGAISTLAALAILACALAAAPAPATTPTPTTAASPALLERPLRAPTRTGSIGGLLRRSLCCLSASALCGTGIHRAGLPRVARRVLATA